MTNPDEDSDPPGKDVPSRSSQADSQTPKGFFNRRIVLGALFSCLYGLSMGLGIAWQVPLAQYGWTTFVGLPLATGFATATLMRPFRSILIATLMGMAATFGALLLFGLEGVVCLLMAAPLMVVSAIAGTFIGIAFRSRPQRGVKLAFFPALGCLAIGISAEFEGAVGPRERLESFSSEVVLAGSPDSVWRQILEIDRVEATKPLLLRIGLPIPISCRLDGEGVGSTRTCCFSTGEIREEITDWEPATRLGMKITGCTLPGRHWLKFVGASYTLHSTPPGQTRLIRTTSINSVLQPAWYWRPLERIGVDAEHEYLFRSLKAAKKPD